EIRKGVINLLQSRFMFRLGDPEDAELSSRIAMSVYQTMIRADAESRSVMRVTPEVLLNLPRYVAIASLIAGGTRAPSFHGQTYYFPPLGEISETWMRHHLELMDAFLGGRKPVNISSEPAHISLRYPAAGREPVDATTATATAANTAPTARDTFSHLDAD